MKLAPFIDYTDLRPTSGKKEISRLCEEAVEYGFASVCINPCNVALVSEKLKGSGVKVCSVVGFPLGAGMPEVKAYEASRACESGADEIDMVMNISKAKEGEFNYIKNEIRSVVDAVPECAVKVILETCLLTDSEIVSACGAAAEAGAHFVKTSTGFSSGGATVKDVELMKKSVPHHMGVKASGGIRDREAAEALVRAGADRLGMSKAVDVCLSEKRRDKAGNSVDF